MNRIIKVCIVMLIGVFLLLFVSYENGYYERLNQEKTLMTEEMILKYEEDLANGVDVTKNDYTIEKRNYENVYTKASLKASNKVENIIDSFIKFLFKKINDAVDE